MSKPKVTITHNDYSPPEYSKHELEGIKEQATRLKHHIQILEEEIRSKESQLEGLIKIIEENTKNK